MKIKFRKELGGTQFIQEVINDRNGKFVFNGEFFEGVEVRTHASRTFFLQDHDHKRRVGDRTRVDNTCVKNFLNHFLIFIFLGKGVMIGTNIGRKASWYKGNGMIMNTTGRRESLGSGKYHLMFINDGLEVLWNKDTLCRCKKKNDRYECDKGEEIIQWNRSQITVQKILDFFFSHL
jgi:hypothetical protein